MATLDGMGQHHKHRRMPWMWSKLTRVLGRLLHRKQRLWFHHSQHLLVPLRSSLKVILCVPLKKSGAIWVISVFAKKMTSLQRSDFGFFVWTVTSNCVSEIPLYSKVISSKHLPSYVAVGLASETSAAKAGKKANIDDGDPSGSRSLQVATGFSCAPYFSRSAWN